MQGITDLINVPGLINLDFADISTVMSNKGIAHIGIGIGKGDEKCVDAVKQAITSPLLETTIEGASDVIINISGDISLIEANDAATYVEELAGEEANIIFGAMYDDTAPDSAVITVIATGLEENEAPQARSASRLMNNAMKTKFNTQSSVKPVQTARPVSHVKPVQTARPQAISRPQSNISRSAYETQRINDTPSMSSNMDNGGGIKIPDFLQRKSPKK